MFYNNPKELIFLQIHITIGTIFNID